MTETDSFWLKDMIVLGQGAPKYSPSRVVQIIKSITAKEIFKMFPEILDI